MGHFDQNVIINKYIVCARIQIINSVSFFHHNN